MRRGIFRRSQLAAVLAALVASATTLVANPAQAATTSAVRGVGSGRCLDVPGASQTDGTLMNIWDCNGASNQQWTLTDSNQGTGILDIL